jgi:hypothetical protein
MSSIRAYFAVLTDPAADRSIGPFSDQYYGNMESAIFVTQITGMSLTV